MAKKQQTRKRQNRTRTVARVNASEPVTPIVPTGDPLPKAERDDPEFPQRLQELARVIEDNPHLVARREPKKNILQRVVDKASSFLRGPRNSQIIAVPRCNHCGSDRVKIVSTQGVPVNGKRWQRQKYRCADTKCKGHTEHSIVMRGPFGVNVAGDKDEAAKVNITDFRKPAGRQKSQIQFAGG